MHSSFVPKSPVGFTVHGLPKSPPPSHSRSTSPYLWDQAYTRSQELTTSNVSHLPVEPPYFRTRTSSTTSSSSTASSSSYWRPDTPLQTMCAPSIHIYDPEVEDIVSYPGELLYAPKSKYVELPDVGDYDHLASDMAGMNLYQDNLYAKAQSSPRGGYPSPKPHALESPRPTYPYQGVEFPYYE